MRLLRKRGAWNKAGSLGRTCIFLAVAVAGLTACSSTPKAINPVELYRSAAGFSLNDDISGERNAQNLAAGSNEPYPNLGTVPPPPDRAMSSIDRQKLQQGLAEDRTEAKQSDADLRGSSTARAAPTPITRPSPGGDAATAETNHKGDPSLPVARAHVNVAHRAPAGSEPAPQESTLNSPDVHAIPEGDTPRPAPPPPYLPPPEKARKPSPSQVAKPAPVATATTRPSPTPHTMDMASQLPAAPAIPPAAPVASAPPPPPPSDLAMPPPNSVAALTPVPPAALDPIPSLPPAAATDAPGAASPVPLGVTEPQKPPAEQMAALDPARSPPAAVPVPAPAQAPEQQAALSPAPQATPTIIPPPAPVTTPEQQAALPPPQATPTIIPPPAPVTTPEQQAALPPPPQATPPASRSDQALAEPVPQRTGRGGTVSLQAAEIDFADNGLTLTAEDNQRLAGVVKLYDKHGGMVRVVGYGRRGFGADAAQQELASFSKAIERANVVARALGQLGLASNRIVVQAAPVGDGLGEDRAEVLLEF